MVVSREHTIKCEREAMDGLIREQFSARLGQQQLRMRGGKGRTSAGVLGVLGNLNLLDLFPQRCTISNTILTGDMNLFPL